jgi:uncharacterized protein YjiS (DUF1127 family)
MNRHSVETESRRTSAEIAPRGLRLIVLHFASWAIAMRERARTRQILSDLDDAGLADIGLTRSGIRYIASDRRYRRQPFSS